MARRIVWSIRASTELKDIFEYWSNRNKSNTYNIKLNHRIQSFLHILKVFPELGKKTDVTGVRVHPIDNYLIFYEMADLDTILIISFWDGRQNPDRIKF